MLALLAMPAQPAMPALAQLAAPAQLPVLAPLTKAAWAAQRRLKAAQLVLRPSKLALAALDSRRPLVSA
jgi:hypothetical protein